MIKSYHPPSTAANRYPPRRSTTPRSPPSSAPTSTPTTPSQKVPLFTFRRSGYLQLPPLLLLHRGREEAREGRSRLDSNRPSAAGGFEFLIKWRFSLALPKAHTQNKGSKGSNQVTFGKSAQGVQSKILKEVISDLMISYPLKSFSSDHS
jgi:hypothetical protein